MIFSVFNFLQIIYDSKHLETSFEIPFTSVICLVFLCHSGAAIKLSRSTANERAESWVLRVVYFRLLASGHFKRFEACNFKDIKNVYKTIIKANKNEVISNFSYRSTCLIWLGINHCWKEIIIFSVIFYDKEIELIPIWQNITWINNSQYRKMAFSKGEQWISKMF